MSKDDYVFKDRKDFEEKFIKALKNDLAKMAEETLRKTKYSAEFDPNHSSDTRHTYKVFKDGDHIGHANGWIDGEHGISDTDLTPETHAKIPRSHYGKAIKAVNNAAKNKLKSKEESLAKTEDVEDKHNALWDKAHSFIHPDHVSSNNTSIYEAMNDSLKHYKKTGKILHSKPEDLSENGQDVTKPFNGHW